MRRAQATIVLVALGAVAHAGPGQSLDKARAAFRAKDCQSAMPFLKDLLYPSESLGDRSDLFEARAMLGACEVDTGHRDDAKREFRAAIQLKPYENLDAAFYSEPAIRVFDETKADIEAQTRRDIELQKLRDAQNAYQKYLDSLVVYEQHQFYLNFAPFGFGQFQNNDTAKGVFFATSQGLMLGSSVAIWGYLVNKYGIRSDHVPLADGPNVRFLQQIEIGSGLMFLGLWVYSSIDAYRHYQPQTRIEGNRSLLPPGIVDPTKKKPAKPKQSSLLDHLSPMITPNGGGIGLSWEN